MNPLSYHSNYTSLNTPFEQPIIEYQMNLEPSSIEEETIYSLPTSPYFSSPIIQYSDINGHYEGQHYKGLANGEGKFVYRDGSIYTGQWRLGKRHGIGSYQKQDGTVEKSEWAYDFPVQVGKHRYTNDDFYVGRFYKQGAFITPHGYGLYQHSNGSSYEGEFLHGKPHGDGVFKNDEEHFIGSWINGIRDEGRLYKFYNSSSVSEDESEENDNAYSASETEDSPMLISKDFLAYSPSQFPHLTYHSFR